MSILYVALMLFIASSLLIGIFELMNWSRTWVLVAVPMTGAIALFSASILLIVETRLALRSVDEEMKYSIMLDQELLNLKSQNTENFNKETS